MKDQEPMEEIWWLDSSALPDLFCARMSIMADGTAKVLTLDGVIHDFPNAETAAHWLSEDEYSRYGDLIWTKEISLKIKPPTANRQ